MFDGETAIPLENNKNKKNKKPKWRFFNFARLAPKLRYLYGDVVYLFYRKSAVEHDGGV